MTNNNSNQDPNYPWFKIHSKGWLTGSIRAQLTPAERGVWADLLAMGNESRVRGVICRAKGIPYPREYIANFLEVPVELLNSTIEKCVNDINADDPTTRIMFDEYGCLVISNWNKYQAKPEKSLAKEAAIEKTKQTKRHQESLLQRQSALLQKMFHIVNIINSRDEEYQYAVVDGRIVDKKSGEFKSIEELEQQFNVKDSD